MNGSVVVLMLAGGVAYFFLMSAMGKWLAKSRERASVAFVPGAAAEPAARERIAS